jgi:hypothetical protein
MQQQFGSRLLPRKLQRFKQGEKVYVKGWPIEVTGLVVDYIPPTAKEFPAYKIMTEDGSIEKISQLFLSSKPFRCSKQTSVL